MTALEVANAKLKAGTALRIEEAALMLGVAPKTIRGWRYKASRGCPAPALEFPRYGGCVRVSAESVRALLGEGREH